MKYTKYLPFLLSLILQSALGQTGVDPAPRTPSDRDGISAARTRYVSAADGSRPDGDGRTLAQFPRRGPRPPFAPRPGYRPRESYQSPWMDSGSAGHAVIGAAIGFGIGAAMGAIGSAHNKTPVGSGVLLGGSLLGLIGGAIGASHGAHYPFAHRRTVYPRSSPEDEEAGRNADFQDRVAHAQGSPAQGSESVGATSLNQRQNVQAATHEFAGGARSSVNW